MAACTADYRLRAGWQEQSYLSLALDEGPTLTDARNNVSMNEVG